MLRNSVIHWILLVLFCCPIVGSLGCAPKDMTPVQTSGNDIEQFLAENPDENYSSDGQAEAETEEMDEDEQGEEQAAEEG